MAQGNNETGEKDTHSIFVLEHEQIKNTPKDQTITYARMVIDYCPQRVEPNRVRMTAGGNTPIIPRRTHNAHRRPDNIKNIME